MKTDEKRVISTGRLYIFYLQQPHYNDPVATASLSIITILKQQSTAGTYHFVANMQNHKFTVMPGDSRKPSALFGNFV